MFSVQMYSLREEINKTSLEAVLADVKKAGFDSVETAGFYDLGYDKFKKLLDKFDLKISGAHIDSNQIISSAEEISNMCRTLKARNVIIPYMDLNDLFGANGAELSVSLSNAIKYLKENDIIVGYHNHSYELQGEDLLARLLRAFPDIVLELDVFWASVAGVDPLGYIKKNREKIKILHIKELSALGKDDVNPLLGKGIGGTAQVLRTAKSIGIDQIVLEVEKLPCDYFQYLTHAYNFFKENYI